MQSTGRVPQHHHVNVILSKAVSQDSNHTSISPQVEQGGSKCLDTAKGLHSYRLGCVVLYLYFYVPKGRLFVNADHINQIWTACEACAGNGQLLSMAKNISKIGLFDSTCRVIYRTDPALVDLSRDLRTDHRTLRAVVPDLIRTIVFAHYYSQVPARDTGLI